MTFGPVGPHGRATYKLKIAKDLLPAECTWSGGGQGGRFIVHDDTPKNLFFSIDKDFGPSGPRDDKTELQQHKEVQEAPVQVDQHEKVE